MKKIFFLFIIILLVVNLVGCGNIKTEQYSEYKRQDIKEFKSIFRDFAKKNNIKASHRNIEAFNDITPEDVFKEAGCQIFKNGITCESFLLYNGNLYSLGIGFGGLGIVDIVTCDFDNNDEKELLYTYSWGSGIHRSCFGYFDLSKKSEGQVDISSDKLSDFIGDELVLNKISDKRIEVYTANVTIRENDFTKLTFKEEKLFGEIRAVKSKPVLFIE